MLGISPSGEHDPRGCQAGDGKSHLLLPIATCRGARCCRLPGGRLESRAGAGLQRFPQEWKWPGDKKVLRTQVFSLQGPPCSADIGHQLGSPALCLQRNHSFLQQALVYVRLQKPRIGVLQETASSLWLFAS